MVPSCPAHSRVLNSEYLRFQLRDSSQVWFWVVGLRVLYKHCRYSVDLGEDQKVPCLLRLQVMAEAAAQISHPRTPCPRSELIGSFWVTCGCGLLQLVVSGVLPTGLLFNWCLLKSKSAGFLDTFPVSFQPCWGLSTHLTSAPWSWSFSSQIATLWWLVCISCHAWSSVLLILFFFSLKTYVILLMLALGIK
jgi:hypothetical protein